jgi:hypothetical protein
VRVGLRERDGGDAEGNSQGKDAVMRSHDDVSCR